MTSSTQISQQLLLLFKGSKALIVIQEQLGERVDDAQVLRSIRMAGLAVAGSNQRLLLGGVLLLQDIQIGVDALDLHRLAPEQLVEVFPFAGQSLLLLLPTGDDPDEPVHDLKAFLLHFNNNPDKVKIQLTMLANLFTQGLSGVVSNVAEEYTLLKDHQVLPHLAKMLAKIKQTSTPEDSVHLSNLVKQTDPSPVFLNPIRQELTVPSANIPNKNKDYQVRKFTVDSQKLQWAGVSLTREEVFLVDKHLSEIAEKHKEVRQIRFWGKILGLQLDYYVLQAVCSEVSSLQEIEKGAEKRGEGCNFFTYWVSNSLYSGSWIELPLINPQHVKQARKIKKYFSGHLERPIFSEPPFKGLEKHYLKAQIVRITHALEIAPKGIYKPNDDNPKIVELQEEPKMPEFAQLSTLDSWIHRNQNILNLGRCSHYIDPSLPQDQIEAATAQLAEKDPQIERLRGITEDKLPEGSPLGVENVWQIRLVGDTQVFQKDEGVSVYGAVTLRNLYWPGWVTVANKSGFANYYTGFGLKWVQAGWSNYENSNLIEQAEQAAQFPEPNPKQQPKPPALEEPAPQDPPEE